MRPNGIAFSPDQKKLYVNDSEKGHIRVFNVKPDGTLENKRIFAELKNSRKKGVPDGMKVDEEGNVYSTGPGGCGFFHRQATCWARLKCQRLPPTWPGVIATTKRFILRRAIAFTVSASKSQACNLAKRG